MDQSEEKFVIDNDKKAEWALEQIKEKEEECTRLINLALEKIQDLNMQIVELNNKCANETGYYKGLLAEYFNTVPHKETKTQESYQLLSGKLVYKKPSVKINHDDEKLIEWLSETEYVETKQTIKWGEYKKNLTVQGNDVIDVETGEVVEACTVEEVPASFEIKFKEA